MVGSLNFGYRDLYPTMGVSETSTEVVPGADDMEALNENAGEAKAASKTFARGTKMILAVGVLLAVIVFLGGGE